MRTIKIIVAGEMGAGSTTVATEIQKVLKLTFPESRVHLADDDDTPQGQADRIKAIRADTMNCVITTQQIRSSTIPPVNYEVEVRDLLKDVKWSDTADGSRYTIKQVSTAINLARACGCEHYEQLYVTALFKWLKDWLDKPQAIDSLEKREIEDGARKKGDSKRHRGKQGGFGLKG